MNCFLHFLNKFSYFIILFYFFIVFSVLGLCCCTWAFLWLQRAGATLRCGARASHCGGFSCCREQALGTRASVVVARGLSSCGSRALECRLSSCGAQAQLLRSMWDLPRPGLEPVSPALAGGFSATAPPGKPSFLFLMLSNTIHNKVYFKKQFTIKKIVYWVFSH